MSNTKAQQIVKALKASKEFLAKSLHEERASGFKKSEFICVSIDKAAFANKLTKEECEAGKKYIERHLGKHDTFTSWMRANHPTIPVSHDREYQSGVMMQKTRRQWVDYLINALQS